MAKRNRGGKGKTSSKMAKPELIRGEKPEIIKENGIKQFGPTILKERAEGKTMREITANKVKQIIAEKNTPSPKLKDAKKLELAKKQTSTPPSAKVNALKSSTNLTPPNMAVEKAKAVKPEKTPKPSLSSLKDHKPAVKPPAPAKKPPTPGR